MSTCEWGMTWNARAATGRRATGWSRRAASRGLDLHPHRAGHALGHADLDARVAEGELAAVDLPARGPHHDRGGRTEVADVGGQEPTPALQDGFLRGHLRPLRHRLLEDEHVVLARGGLRHDAKARGTVPEARRAAASGP